MNNNTMHTHRYKSTLWRLSSYSMHFIFNTLLMLAALIVCVHSALTYNMEHLYIGIGMGVFWMFSSLVFVARVQSLRCPLCMVPLFANKRCGKNKKAKRLLGSHRLSVSTQILFCGNYRCIYCGEKFDARRVSSSQQPGRGGSRRSLT